MDTGMQNMLDMYLYETNTLIDELDGILLESEKDAGVFSQDDVNEIFRIMHTVKGSSAMMQFNSLSTIAHQVEDLFFFIREHGGHQEFGQDLFDLLFRASDFVKAQTEKIENNQPIAEDVGALSNDISVFLAALQAKQKEQDAAAESQAQGCVAEENSSASAMQGDEGEKQGAGANGQGTQGGRQISGANGQNGQAAWQGSGSEGSGGASGQWAEEGFRLLVFFDKNCGMENLRAFMLASSIGNVCESFDYYPDQVETDPSTTAYILEHGFTMRFHSEADRQAAVDVVKSSLNIASYTALEPPCTEPQSVPCPEIVSQGTGSGEPDAQSRTPDTADSKNVTHLSGGKQNLISVNLSKLDKLMAIVGEIVITESMVTSSPDLKGFKLDNFTKSARQLRKLTDDLQDTVMSIRMVPVSGVFQKMNRVVRDMSQSLSKPARLVTTGADTEVDKTIVDSIGDPIMHIVRNSMDHGLEESVEERIAADKDPEGTITLSAQHTGSEVIISVSDDGAGVDIQKVLEKAKENGLLTKPESEYTQRDILQFLLMPGFSTNEEVTEYSGRGVGMDVVKKNIERVGGIVTMSTEKGRGSCTTFKIPLTLAIVDGMEISVGNSIFTVPIHNIRQSFKVTPDDIVYDANRGEMIRRMDRFYPLIRIHDFYELKTEITNLEDGIVMWVESDDKSYCLFVDDLLGEQQVVVKPLPSYLYSFNIKNSGIAGCTILGDGNISIILDIQNLYDAVTRRTFS